MSDPINIVPQTHERLIEIGWLVSSDVKKSDRDVITQARNRMLALLQQDFGQFQWRMPVILQPQPGAGSATGAAKLLYEAAYERDGRHWDYAFVITGADLTSYYKPFAFAMPSQALAVAVMSTARLASRSLLADNSETWSTCKAQRLFALSMHLLGDLNGLDHQAEPSDFMYEPRDMDELDRMNNYSTSGRQRLLQMLTKVADLRLEEQPSTKTGGVGGFYVRALWLLRKDIVSAVLEAKPWQFPFRLSRLTTAALSTLFILMMTAEAWDLGMNQQLPLMSIFSLLVLLGTSLFIVKRQKLMLRRSQRRLTEQIVVTNVASGLIVLMGMAVTYLMLFCLTLLFAEALFTDSLVASWAASLEGQISWQHYLSLAELVASLGLLIGALGASFEGQDYFRHIAYVDEEL
jgi:predicted Zn-dependent protease